MINNNTNSNKPSGSVKENNKTKSISVLIQDNTIQLSRTDIV